MEEAVHGDCPDADISDEWREVFEEILSQQRHWFERMAERVPRPNREDRLLYARILKGQGVVFDHLELAWPFTQDELKRAWRKAIHEKHPDRGGDGQVFVQVKDSYEEARRLLGHHDG